MGLLIISGKGSVGTPSAQTDSANIEEPEQLPESVSLSPLPRSIRGMQKSEHSKADYVEMTSHIPEVQERLNNGDSLESLIRDSRLGACAAQ